MPPPWSICLSTCPAAAATRRLAISNGGSSPPSPPPPPFTHLKQKFYSKRKYCSQLAPLPPPYTSLKQIFQSKSKYSFQLTLLPLPFNRWKQIFHSMSKYFIQRPNIFSSLPPFLYLLLVGRKIFIQLFAPPFTLLLHIFLDWSKYFFYLLFLYQIPKVFFGPIIFGNM